MLSNIRIRTRLVLLVVVLQFGMICIGGLGLFGTSKANQGMGTIYEDRTVPLMDLGLVIDMINRMRINALTAANAPNPEVAVKANADALTLDGEVDKLWAKYLATYLTPEEKQLADGFDQQIGDGRRFCRLQGKRGQKCRAEIRCRTRNHVQANPVARRSRQNRI
jgi:hypothetical protein